MDDPELKRLLDETHALAKDNHRMLRAIRRDQWFGFIGKVAFWIIILVLPYWLYQQYLAPIVSQYTSSATSAASGLQSSSTGLQKLVHSYLPGG